MKNTNQLDIFNYLGIVNINRNCESFLEHTDGKNFDYTKVNSSWNRINQYSKIEWIRQQMKLQDYNDIILEIINTFVLILKNQYES
jgi:hypothetical protein